MIPGTQKETWLIWYPNQLEGRDHIFFKNHIFLHQHYGKNSLKNKIRVIPTLLWA